MTAFGQGQQPGRVSSGDDWLTVIVWTGALAHSAAPVLVWNSGGGSLDYAADNAQTP